jgi:chorismate mutase
MLSKRMRISREIGTYKIEHQMPILQTNRYNEILIKRIEQAVKMGVSGEFTKRLLEVIHEESVRQQMKIMQAVNKENSNDKT